MIFSSRNTVACLIGLIGVLALGCLAIMAAHTKLTDTPQTVSRATPHERANEGLAKPLLPNRANHISQQDQYDTPLPAAPAILHLSPTRLTWWTPRLKPPAIQSTRQDPQSPVKTIDLTARYLAPFQYVAFFHENDLTGRPAKERPSPQRVIPDHGALTETLYTLRKNETLSDLMKRAGVTIQDINAIATAIVPELDIRKLKPGTVFEVSLATAEAQDGNVSKKVTHLAVKIDETRTVHLTRQEDKTYIAHTKIHPLSIRVTSFKGHIRNSLFSSVLEQGFPIEATSRLANLFLYDIDFQRDLQKGDRFEAIFEALYNEKGLLVGVGDILLGYMTWRGGTQGKTYYRFSSPQEIDWYDTEGQSARRLLMKTPIEGARISSGFGRRRHPVLGYNRIHKGVDFAARSGTPVMATGSGRIRRANRYGSFGNYVKIRHANGYETTYAHLKSFAKDTRKGRHVSQGQIIAYVGTTGRSTGPHLHYEVLHKGKQINPMTLKIASGKKLKGEPLAQFILERDWIESLRLPRPEKDG